VTYIIAHWNWASFFFGILASFLISFGGMVGWWFILMKKSGPMWREITREDFERVKRLIRARDN
jgi:hypothetical protein